MGLQLASGDLIKISFVQKSDIRSTPPFETNFIQFDGDYLETECWGGLGVMRIHRREVDTITRVHADRESVVS